MKKVFRFHAKRGQADMVIGLLSRYGTPTTETTPEGVKVFVELPNGVSKRSVDRMLRDAGVPGAASCRNVPLIKVARGYPDIDEKLEHLARQGHVGKVVKVTEQGTKKIIKGRLTQEPFCDGPGWGYYLT